MFFLKYRFDDILLLHPIIKYRQTIYALFLIKRSLNYSICRLLIVFEHKSICPVFEERKVGSAAQIVI
jgi:hypothetical protein